MLLDPTEKGSPPKNLCLIRVTKNNRSFHSKSHHYQFTKNPTHRWQCSAWSSGLNASVTVWAVSAHVQIHGRDWNPRITPIHKPPLLLLVLIPKKSLKASCREEKRSIDNKMNMLKLKNQERWCGIRSHRKHPLVHPLISSRHVGGPDEILGVCLCEISQEDGLCTPVTSFPWHWLY